MENSIDNLLVSSLRKQIEQNLGTEKLEKIQKRLIERHGMNMVQAVKDFYKMDSVLREFFGANADEIELKSLKKVIKLKNTKDWISIQDKELSKIFLNTLGDEDKKKIIGTVLKKPLTIASILNESNIPQTSGYRKINSMIKEGILVNNGYDLSNDGKKIKKYETVFENIKMDINDSGMVVKIQFKNYLLSNSTIFQIIQI
ncbi:MAG: transcriptional regulator [Nitrosopumilus sp.]|uniref:transcriptional regulator n=1 Tax=Nitrosopumilus sp. TaxID=2024843 RepID=UPI00247D3E9E|nr:transcriptional regulator [Nitrosopumilus sp.]MCV0392361.1 transcriptional regulator [Nitrosopumilus sp.]